MAENANSTFKLTNALIYDTSAHEFRQGSLTVTDGVISEVNYGASENGTGIDLGGMRLVPGMVDIHTHGRSGYDMPYVNSDELDTVRASYAKAGTTTFMATIGSCPVDDTRRLIKTLRCAKPGKGLANVGGLHFEGRYINLNRKGAHHPSLIAPPDCDEIKELLALAHAKSDGETPLVTHVTAAPELEGGMEFLRTVIENGATFAIGHSDATYDEAIAAVNAGASSFSHLFNAMRPIHHRDMGTAGAGLLSDAYAELICDGIHLSPSTVQLVHRMKRPERVVLITDSCQATGLPDGVYKKGKSEIIVKDGKVTLPDGTISGSTLSLYNGMLNYAKFCGITYEEAIPLATVNPAKLVGLDGVCGSIEAGKRADLLVCGDDMKLCRVLVNGLWIDE